MAPKRKEVMLSPVRQTKKPRRDAQAEKLRKQLQEVADALKKAPITFDVAQMLENILELSLGEFSDQRHRFQWDVIEVLAETLGEAETGLRKEVADVKAQRDLVSAQKAQHEKEFEEASGRAKTKADEVHSLKVALADKAMAFRTAAKNLAEAEDAKRADGKKAKEAEKKVSDFETGVEHLKVLSVLSPADDEASQRADSLLSLLKRCKFEESMLIALPAALAKAPDARGQFDQMALTELEAELGKLIAEQKEIIAAAIPSQQKCEAAVKEAQEHLAAIRAEQRTAARSFDVGNQEQATCEAASSEAQKALRSTSQLLKRLDTSLNNAEVEVELFEQGPLETFKELKDRSTPAPIVEEEMPDTGIVEEPHVEVVAAC